MERYLEQIAFSEYEHVTKFVLRYGKLTLQPDVSKGKKFFCSQKAGARVVDRHANFIQLQEIPVGHTTMDGCMCSLGGSSHYVWGTSSQWFLCQTTARISDLFHQLTSGCILISSVSCRMCRTTYSVVPFDCRLTPCHELLCVKLGKPFMFLRLEAITLRLEAIASRLEAIAARSDAGSLAFAALWAQTYSSESRFT